MLSKDVKLLLACLYEGGPNLRDSAPFMSKLGCAMRAHVVAVQAHDMEHRSGQIDFMYGLGPEWQVRYAKWAGQHPWYILGGSRLLTDGIADDEGLLTEAELQATNFHEAILKPTGVSHGMALLLHSNHDGQMAVLTVNRDHRGGYYTPEERRKMRMLLPDLRNIYTIWQRLSWLQSQMQTFRAALDVLSDGVLLLDAAGGDLFTNCAAQLMESKGLFVHHPDGRFGLHRPAEELALRAALLQFGLGQRAEPFVASIRNAKGRLIGTIKACPVSKFSGPWWSESQACAILFIKSLDPPNGAPVSAILRQQWRFTEAESRLALALVGGSTLDEAADALRVSRNTVRTQLRAIFDKTETRRQAELIRILLRLTHN